MWYALGLTASGLPCSPGRAGKPSIRDRDLHDGCCVIYTYCSHVEVASLFKNGCGGCVDLYGFGRLRIVACSFLSLVAFSQDWSVPHLHPAAQLISIQTHEHIENRAAKSNFSQHDRYIFQPCVVVVGRMQLIRSAGSPGQRKGLAAPCQFLWIFLDMVTSLSHWLYASCLDCSGRQVMYFSWIHDPAVL
jgi:hypothetical protein